MFLISIGKFSVILEFVTFQKRLFFSLSFISICQREQGHFQFLFSFPSLRGLFLFCVGCQREEGFSTLHPTYLIYLSKITSSDFNLFRN